MIGLEGPTGLPQPGAPPRAARGPGRLLGILLPRLGTVPRRATTTAVAKAMRRGPRRAAGSDAARTPLPGSGIARAATSGLERRPQARTAHHLGQRVQFSRRRRLHHTGSESRMPVDLPPAGLRRRLASAISSARWTTFHRQPWPAWHVDLPLPIRRLDHKAAAGTWSTHRGVHACNNSVATHKLIRISPHSQLRVTRSYRSLPKKAVPRALAAKMLPARVWSSPRRSRSIRPGQTPTAGLRPRQ
mmetsp:Transcript_7106/g.17051  ORF Transcript_7106/g.17051 Transcript_7106/m.17051 type:complete len:245 (+) Transcript_7106:1227-1961(+)